MSLIINFKTSKLWREKVERFSNRLSNLFGERLELVASLPSPNDLIYDSNVLVVLDEVKADDLEAVASLAPEDVNPLVVPSSDVRAIDAFLHYERSSPKNWKDKVSEFASCLSNLFGERLELVASLPSPNDLIYDSNVLVVLDEVKADDLEAVASLAPEDVNPLVVPSSDVRAIDAFLCRGGVVEGKRRKQGRSP